MEMEGGWGGHEVWIGVAGGCRGGETDTESAKIVVVSSCEGMLLWFHQAHIPKQNFYINKLNKWPGGTI
jgi:hypothetical protein